MRTFAALLMVLTPGAGWGLQASLCPCYSHCSSPPRNISWTDPVVGAGATKIKGAHVDELMECIDMVRGQSALPVAYSTATANVSKPVDAGTWSQMRGEINTVYTNAGLSAPPYVHPDPIPRVSKVYAQDLVDLRNAIANAPGGAGLCASCTAWADNDCGLGGCAGTLMEQTRSCSPADVAAGCQTTRCVRNKPLCGGCNACNVCGCGCRCTPWGWCC